MRASLELRIQQLQGDVAETNRQRQQAHTNYENQVRHWTLPAHIQQCCKADAWLEGKVAGKQRLGCCLVQSTPAADDALILVTERWFILANQVEYLARPTIVWAGPLLT